MRHDVYDQARRMQKINLSKPSDYDEPPCGSFFKGVVNAVLITVIGGAVIWWVAANAFSDVTERPAGCEMYRAGEVAACAEALR